jgi:hypothetical protein
MHLLDTRLYCHLACTGLSAGDIDAAEQALDRAKPLIHPDQKLDFSTTAFCVPGCCKRGSA